MKKCAICGVDTGLALLRKRIPNEITVPLKRGVNGLWLVPACIEHLEQLTKCSIGGCDRKRSNNNAIGYCTSHGAQLRKRVAASKFPECQCCGGIFVLEVGWRGWGLCFKCYRVADNSGSLDSYKASYNARQN